MGDPPRILVADSDADHLDLLRRTLRKLGSVETATTADEAWSLVAAWEPAAVVACQRLAGMPGLELLHRVSGRVDFVGRILLTNAGDTAATVSAAERRRVDAVVSKPCLPHQLRLMVESVLERRRLERDNVRLVEDLTTRNLELSDAMDALRTAQQRVLDSERLCAIGRMIAMIVHDLRGPLTVIRSAGNQIARGASDPDDVRALASDICDEASRLARMSTHLLDVSRASGGTLSQAEEDVDGLLLAALSALAEPAGRAGVRVETALSSGARMRLDAERLRRVVLNLGQNAIEAMPGGGKLRVASGQDEEGVWISVSDTGRGIPGEIRQSLFDPFVTAGKSGGSGLGLAVVKKVVEDHGGSVQVTKAGSGGACFEIRLPAYLTIRS